MIMLKSTHKNQNLKSLFFIKIASFIILTWIYPYYNNQNTISKTLENGGELNISLDVKTHRSLAKSEQENELGNLRLKHKTSNYGENHKLLYINDDNNTYEKVKRGKPNHMEAYLKSYNSRYTKEKGLKKLDCYYEKKLFESLHKIFKLADQKNISKSRIKRIIFTKYGLLIFIISLLPLLTLAIPGYVGRLHTIIKCKAVPKTGGGHKVDHTDCDYTEIEYNSYRFIFIFILTIVILLLIIYIYIKTMKYMRIKSGMLK
ncbi:hypothetical protein PVNG_05794 [Plasmodium vivax North Korean]|uniref:Variable surface protein Vir35 n=1 Tax=Plasmodium vivax North Korean TaxID=1035514 RepID=A0A0J9WF18_PLAVI|nr:hypothetical protein PVNG_05794 [Plasmodium vivax North Korean]